MQLLVVICFLFSAFKAHATELFETHTNARAMAMGNAYTAIVNDDESLFYNPAGIGKHSGFIFTLLDFRAGLNTLDMAALTDQFANLGSAATFNATVDEMYGDPLWIGAGAKAAFMMPFVGFAYYTDIDASILVQNPAATQIDINYIFDQGVALGAGFSAGIIDMGVVVKRIERTGTRSTFGPGEIAAIVDGDAATPDNIFDNIDANGLGYGVDFGVNFSFPGPISPTISGVWKNIGNTSFRNSSLTAPEPPVEKQEIIVGLGVETSLPLCTLAATMDFKHLEESDNQLPKKVHMGIELGIPMIDIRAGLHQGYFSYGAGLSLGIMQVDFASWGVELGEYPGQLEDRRYLVQMTIKLGFDPQTGFTTGKKGGDSSASGSDGAGGSGSSAARRGSNRRMKLRR